MKRTLTALTVAATMVASSASAFDPDDLQKLKDTGNCIGCNLESAILSGADLSGADLSGANLKGAYLKGAYLRGANLYGAIMNGANLKGAILRGANVNGIILCNTTMPDGRVSDKSC